MQLLPSIALRRYVKHYLWLRKPAAGNGTLHIFGDGNPGIAFCCHGRLYQDEQQHLPLPPIFAYGQISAHRCIYAPGNVSLLIVVLQPFALSGLLRTAGSSLTDALIDGKELIYTECEKEYTLLTEAISTQDRIQALDQLMRKIFTDDLDAGQLLVAATLEHISQLEGRICSTGLVHFTGYSERYLEKKFKEHVGFSPMRFTRIVRILNYIKAVERLDEMVSLTRQACQAGYYDQAHLNHEFKKLTGITPSAFATDRQPLALNFFTISDRC